MGEVERLARMICRALHAFADPDDKVVSHTSIQPIGHMILLPRWEPMPLWRMYEEAARVMAAEIERRLEEGSKR